jgi:hypothetical protein
MDEGSPFILLALDLISASGVCIYVIARYSDIRLLPPSERYPPEYTFVIPYLAVLRTRGRVSIAQSLIIVFDQSVRISALRTIDSLPLSASATTCAGKLRDR